MHQNNAVGAKKYRYMFFLVLIFGAEGAENFFLWFSDLFLWFFGIFRYSYGFFFLWFFSMKSHPGELHHEEPPIATNHRASVEPVNHKPPAQFSVF